MRSGILLLSAAIATLLIARGTATSGTEGMPARGVDTATASGSPTVAGGAAPRARRSASAAAAAAFRFQAALTYQFRRGEGFHDPEAIAIADIDGDGRDDLIGAARYNQILVWRQQPDGTLSDLATHTFADDVYLNRGELVVADFNNDGIADVAASGLRKEVWGINNDTINLLLSNRGGPPVQRQVVLGGIERLGRWQVLDVNRDGRSDIVGAMFHLFPAGTRCGLDGALDPTYCPAIGVAYGNGRGDFTRLEPILIGTPYGIAETETGDIDGDGLRDLLALAPLPFVFNTTRQQEVWAFRQRPDGGLESRATLYTLRGELGTVSLAAGDIARDDRHRSDTVSVSLDSILRAHRQGDPGQPIATQDPFTPPDRMITWANAVLAEDIDGDRRGDVIASQMQWMGDFGIPQIAVYLQRDGVLQTPFYIEAPAPHSGLTNRTLAIGDLNGDGCRDLAIAASNYRLGLLYGRDCTQRRQIAMQSFGIAGRAPQSFSRDRVPLRSPAFRARAARPNDRR